MSTSSRPSSASSNHHVLPPIITNEKDRQFLATVTSHINDELDRIDPNDGEQVFVVYKGAFDMVNAVSKVNTMLWHTSNGRNKQKYCPVLCVDQAHCHCKLVFTMTVSVTATQFYSCSTVRMF